MSEKLNIHQRILAVQAACGAAAKTGTARDFGNYQFHKIDDVVHHLRPHLLEHGVLVAPSLIDSVSELRQQGNKTAHICRATVEVHFINADKPDDSFSVRAEGEGIDYSDKAPGKAFSYALKTALLAVFALRGQPDIEEENIEQPEPTKEKPKPEQGEVEPLASDAQLNRLRLMLDEPKAAKITIGGKPIRDYIRESLAKNDLTWRDARSQIDWVDEKFAVYDKEKK